MSIEPINPVRDDQMAQQTAHEDLEQAAERLARTALRVMEQRDDLLAALERAFVAMGRAGANADTNHQLRAAWEDARASIAKGRGE